MRTRDQLPKKTAKPETKSASSEKREVDSKRVSELIGQGFSKEKASEIARVEKTIKDTEARRIKTADDNNLAEEIKEKKLLKSERTLKENNLKLAELLKTKDAPVAKTPEPKIVDEIPDAEEGEGKEAEEIKKKIDARTAEIEKMMQDMEKQGKTEQKSLAEGKTYLESIKKETTPEYSKTTPEVYHPGDVVDLTDEKFKKIEEPPYVPPEKPEEPAPAPEPKPIEPPKPVVETSEEKAKKESWLKRKIHRIFQKQEHPKMEVFTEEEKAEYQQKIEDIKNSGKTEEEKRVEIQDLILKRAEERRKRELKEGPLSARMIAGVGKGIEKWDNWGEKKDEKYKLVKRLSKMTISIAIIAGISSSIAGVGVTSNVARRLTYGLGFGGGMELLGSVSPEKKAKLQKILRIVLPVISAGFAIASGTVLAGVAVGGAAAAGYGFSKLSQRKWSEGKIEEKISDVTKSINLDTLDKDLEKIEEDLANVLKKAENIRWTRKIMGGVVAIGSSVIILEASNAVHGTHRQEAATSDASKEAQPVNDPAHQTSNGPVGQTPDNSQNPFAPQPAQPVQPVETVTPPHALHNPPTDGSVISPEELHKIETQHQVETKMEDIIVHKGEGIEHSFIRQIEHNPSLAKELGYNGDLSDAKALHAFAQHEAHVIAIKEGYVDNAGHEVQIAEADKVGYEIKTENGHVVVEEKTADGMVTETHHEGDKFESTADKHEYIKNPSEETSHTETSVTNGETPNIQTNEHETVIAPDQTPHQTENDNTRVEHSAVKEPTNDTTHNTNQETGNVGGETIKQEVVEQGQISTIENPYGLSTEDLNRAHDAYDSNIEKIFPTQSSLNSWLKIENSHNTTADHVIKMDEQTVSGTYKPLVSYMHKLHEVTGLNPREATVLEPMAETNHEFIERALQKAVEMGKLDDVKL